MTDRASFFSMIRRDLRLRRENDVRRWASRHHPQAPEPVLITLVTLVHASNLTYERLMHPTANRLAPIEELYRASAAAHH